MPYGTIVLRRTLICVLAINGFVAAPIFAAPPAGVADAASGELAIDRRLAEQYGAPGPALAPNPVGSATAQLATPAAFDEEAARRLEQEIDAALAEAAAQKRVKPNTRAAAAPEAWSTAAVLSGALLLFALVCVMLTLAVRELRKDAKQRSRSYRRRIRRRQPNDTAPISAS